MHTFLAIFYTVHVHEFQDVECNVQKQKLLQQQYKSIHLLHNYVHVHVYVHLTSQTKCIDTPMYTWDIKCTCIYMYAHVVKMLFHAHRLA